MADARGQSVQVRLGTRATPSSAAPDDAEFSAGGKVIEFPGFLRAYVEGSDDPEAELEDREIHLPPLAPGDPLDLAGMEVKAHETQPPSRFTEASLVKRLEELGVGRPSTYASIIATIQDRGYVWKRGSALVPSFTAFAVVGLLERHFGDLVDYAFTARMEDDLDGIASGDREAVPWLTSFYFGNGQVGLHAVVTERLDEIDARQVNSIVIGRDSEDREIVVRVGKFGPYLQRGEDRASVSDDLAPDELTIEKATELLDAPSGDRVLGTDPETGLVVLARVGRFGPYVQLGQADSDGERPRTASLFKTMSLDTVTLDDARRLLSLPRLLGTDPADGGEVTAQNGRYGPYVKKGAETRSLPDEEHLFSISLEEALRLLAEPKRRRGQGVAAQPLRELGTDPVSGAPVVVKEGRYGPYVTDGEANASLPKGETPETIALERASDLLAERRARGPVKKTAKKRAKKATAARKPAKTPTKAAQKAAKQTTAKKAVKTTAKKAAKNTVRKAATD